ncbi:MAG: uL22 family ribosomal protein [archaeon]
MAINTEKPMGKSEQKKQGIVETPKLAKVDMTKAPIEDKKVDESKAQDSEAEKKKEEPKKPIQKKPVVKKTEVVVNARSVPISTKYAIAICKFINKKKIQRAISDLGEVVVKKKAVPMKGEIPHRKGRIMSGRYPKNASEHFIKLLKSLQSNATNHELDEPVIVEAVANLATRPYGKFGRVRKKRTHVRIVAREKKMIKEKNKKGERK